jgi:predicted DNA-binding transcriptional regulator AlpA
MSPEESSPDQAARAAARSKNVSLSKWVNERFPPWEQLLSAHNVARLTRRPHWLLLGMMAVGRFPRTLKFHGRAIGWLRSDVLDWVAQDSTAARRDPDNVMRILRGRFAQQASLPLECTAPCAARGSRVPCVKRMRRRR